MDSGRGRAIRCNLIIGGLSVLGGAVQACFDRINYGADAELTQTEIGMLAFGGALLLLALLMRAGLRLAHWLSLVGVVAFGLAVNYWAIHDGMHFSSLSRALKGILVLIAIEGALIWAVVVQWAAARQKS